MHDSIELKGLKQNMNQFKKKVSQNAFNEDSMLASVYQQAKDAGLRSKWAKAPKESLMKKKILWLASVAVVLVLGLTIFYQTTWFNKDDSKIVAVVIAVDINPSFELSANSAAIVIKIEALNADALTLDTSDLIGLPVATVIDEIVKLANAAGFIDTSDLLEDYVVLSTVLMDQTNLRLEDKLQIQLQDRIQLSDTLQCINLVEIKATLIQQMEANNKDIPLGLYVLNGMVNTPDGTILSAKEFFSNPENRLAIQNKAKITDVAELKIRSRIELALQTLQADGVDITALQTRLENANLKDMLQIQNEVRTQINAHGKPNDNGNGSGNGASTQSNPVTDPNKGSPAPDNGLNPDNSQTPQGFQSPSNGSNSIEDKGAGDGEPNTTSGNNPN
jgi:hypothetical protein